MVTGSHSCNIYLLYNIKTASFSKVGTGVVPLTFVTVIEIAATNVGFNGKDALSIFGFKYWTLIKCLARLIHPNWKYIL